ncbi:uncharacterized protein LOC114523292 [Dendronephthya gigantea]|uniref:uncharacterized protein LOC114523292 n=1 Tax=Dendronephthya gigantea TaxID=151771 RepID=UPI001068E3AE|nr:uncharacterized protein LOC114523292 [Dendronephthya gigantea]
MKVLRGRNTSLASKFFCLALLKFFCLCVVPCTSGFITDIYEDHTIEFENETLEINRTVNVHENATLTIQPGASIKFSGNGSLHVYGNLIANGTETLPIDISSEIEMDFQSLRLVNGNGYSSGRLEIFHQGIWGSVCRDGWSQINNDVVCRELGFSTGTLSFEFGAGTGQIWMDDVRCTEADRSLRHCSHRGFGSHNCVHQQDVGLKCTGIRLNLERYEFSRSILHFAGKGKSSLINVRIHSEHEHRYLAKNSSLSTFSRSTAIVCDSECPYVTRLNISGFHLAVEIRNYGNTLLRNTRIISCFYGVVATNNPVNSSVRNNLIGRYKGTETLRLEKISVANTTVGLYLDDNSSLPIEVEDTATKNCHIGVVISKTVFTRVKLSNLMLEYGTDAITLRTKPGRFEQIDICDSSNSAYNGLFPVEISTYRYNSNPCSMMFATSPGQVLAAFVSDLSYINLRIRDSNSSELLFELSSDNLSQQYIVELKSSAVIVEIEFEGYWWHTRKFKMFLRSRPESSSKNNINEISNVTIRQFTEVGISLNVDSSTTKSTTIIRNSHIANTSANSIIAILGQGSILKLINSTFQYNGYSHTEAILKLIINGYSLVQVNGNIFHQNQYRNIFNIKTSTSGISRSNPEYILKITNNTFQYNTNSYSETAMVELFFHGYFLVEVIGNTFHKNYYENILESDIYASGWSSYNRGSSLKLVNNIFQYNRIPNNLTPMLLFSFIGSYSYCPIQIIGNIFQNNHYEEILKFRFSTRWNSRNKLSLLDNRLFNNTAKNLVDFTGDAEVVVIRGNTLLHNAVVRSIFSLVNNDYNPSSSLNFTRNSLIANVVHRRSPRSSYDTNDVAAVICLSRKIFMNENFFENPFLSLELMLTPNLNSHHIDGRMNWWGSTDVNDVIARIFDFRHRNYLPQLTFSPFLASANLSDVFKGETNIMFRKGRVLGGLVTEDIILEKDNSPFIVTRDVIILPNATLTIQAGVQVNVFPNIGFHVYGKFELLGELSAPIKFDIATRLDGISSFGQYPIRLVNGSKPWEGIVEILYNNTWGTICDNYNSYANSIVLCKQLGFEGYISSYRYTPSSGSAKPVWWGNLRCNSGTHYDIGSCPFEGWGVSCYSSLWTVRCNPGSWRGIRFRETAKASQISHVKFEHGGGNTQPHISRYVLHFDVLRQVIKDVEIRESFGGIKIAFQAPDSNMANILIQNRNRDSGNGIEIFSSLNCYHCGIFNKNTAVFIQRIDIRSFIDDREIKYIDSILPDIMLRKEISLCEQNREITIGREDMQIITTSRTTSYSSTNVECIFNITLLSEAFLTTVMKISDVEALTITASKVNSSKNISFNASHSDAYNFGPGYLTVRYWRKAYSSGTNIRIAIVSAKGNDASWFKNEPATAILFAGSLFNNYYGIRGDQSGGIRYLKLQHVTLKGNTYGIYGYHRSTNVSLDNCTITDGNTAVYVQHNYYSNDFFANSHLNYLKLENCVIRRMSYAVIHFRNYDYYHYLQQKRVVSLHRCILHENGRIYYGYHYQYYYDRLAIDLYVSECSISQTTYYGFEIDLPDPTKTVFSFSLDKNLIFKNRRTLLRCSVFSMGSLQTSISIIKNIFVNNSLPAGEGLIDFYGKQIRSIITDISNNTFIKNKCSFLIKVDVQSNRVPKTFMIKNNILEHNEGVPSNNQKYIEAGITSYTVGLFGCMFNLYDIHGNIFNNEEMKKELFVGLTCGTNYLSNTIDATLNYWGTSSRKHLTERIFHFDNWSDRPRIKYLPAAATRNFTAILKPKPHTHFNQSQIGGYVHFSLNLTAVNSPYVVMNDLIISQNATLDIEPGVQLYFKPHIGLLVLGNIIARGTTNEKITFCSLENKCEKRSQSRVRLFGGDYEHKGKVEVLVDGIWQSVCFSYFSSNDGTVVCRQLGYGRYINHYSRYYDNSPHYKVSWNCRGNETSLLNCKNQSISNCGGGWWWGHSRHHGVILECERNFKWGGVRIIHQNFINSTGYGEKNEQSLLRNILIHHAGILHEEDAPSIQVIRRSPSIAHVDIRESNGIKIIAHTHTMALENVNVESGLKFPAISILGNKGSVSISRCSFKRGKQHAIAISPIKNITFMYPYLGHNLCNSVQKVYVDDESYIYLSEKDKITNIFCGLEISSPRNTIIHFRLLSWVRSSYTVNVYNGDRSSMIARIYDWNVNQYEDKVIVIPSNSVLIEADISTLRGFLAEITVIGETGRSKQKPEINVNIEECNFQEISGSAVHYTSDPELASTVTIKRSHVTLQGNKNQPNTASIEMLVRNNDTVEISNTVFSSVNRGGIHIYLYDKPGVINIVNNVISGNANSSESVHVVAVGSGTSSELLMAGNYFNRNDISYPHGLVVIKNMNAVAKDNVFYQNNAEIAFNLVNSKSLNTSSTVTRNVFLLNRGYLHTLLIQPNGREMINENSMVNPTNLFELSTLPSSSSNIVINATNNWWGNVDPNVIMRKIKDKRRYAGLPRVIYQPFLTTPTLIFSTGLCPFDWIHLDRKCYKNLRSPHSFTKSKEMCKKIGGKMLAFHENQIQSSEVLHKLHSKWAYGTRSNIWIDVLTQDSIPFQNNRCWMFDGTIKEASCDLKNPTICEKSKRVRCINDCSLNGICLGQTCKCNNGWEGADCSSYHCKDVGNCGTFGTCIGPNHCKCRIGWKGRGCTVSYCLPFRTCQSCLSRRGCGWCDNTRKCLPGTGYKADIGQCKSWFYHNCISVGRNPSCSSAIKVIDCSTNLCNLDQSRSNKGSCQQCKDLERCYNYNNTDNSTSPICYGWDERKCTKGFVLKDYEDTSRIDKVVTMSNVKLINSDDLKLYGCPVEEGFVIVTKQSSMKLEKGDIISSTQAEGVFHKIKDIAFTDQHVLMSVIPATLEEAISYSDFNQEVRLQSVLVQDLFEDRPDDSLLQDVLSGDSQINGTKVHHISTGSGKNVYKCLARTYTTDDNEEVTTFFLVIPMTSIDGNLSVGHVLVGNSSDGFLETITDIIQEEDVMFVYTELTACSQGFSNLKKYKILEESTSSCLGGDDLLGLKIAENVGNVTIGDIIVGRESGAFFGKVLSFYTENENYFVELMPLISVKDGNVTEQFNISDTTPRRRKRARFSLTTRARFRKSATKKIGRYVKLGASVEFDAGVKISLQTSYSTLKSVGITLFGNMKLNLNCNFDPTASYSKPWSKKLVDKEVGRFCIPIIGAVCVPGVFRLNIGASASVSASASASLSASLTSRYSISAGGEWHKGHGVRRIFNKGGSTQPSFKARLKEASASVSASLTPTFEAHWPSVIPRRLKKKAVRILRKILGGKNSSNIPSLFVFKLTAPLTTSLNAKFCTEKCPDSGGNIEATFRGGLPKISGSLTVNIGPYNKNFKLFGIPVYENVQSKCFSTGPIKVPCCIKDGKPGKIDPKTKDCEEECDCIPGDSSSLKGVKMPDGSCKCEMCPDNSVKRKRSGNKPECPCLCKDNTEKEMNTDGSCPCSCSCEDGTEDTIAWDGSCPCKCSCEGFLESTRGPFGCKCEEKCPVCEDGEEPMWIDQKCKCREKFNCGVPPVCVIGRKGPNCQLPDCWPCQGCSGNGFCVTDSSCRSRCLCRRRWQGRCCERRRPVRWWGDPHLQTLDGVEFDYFGIGEFWNCKSIKNDFGMQIRFFGYKGASLTGAVALKVAENVVTITTLPVSSPGDLPMLRVNGALQNFSGNNAQPSFANDSIKLNIFNPENRTESNGAQVIIMSFQYKSGVTVSVEAEYSPVMSRHYLNVNFIPNADFTKATEGLCGFMDDDETNDLIGPNGEQYNKNDTIEFAESWRITGSRNGSGLVNSWNWNSSNFHAEDVMDSSYTNEEHTPLYTLDNFSQNQVEEAKGVCNRNGLENTLLDNCVFDILMTNDTSFADQQSLQIGCPNDCTGKGLCLNATCRCLEGWSGDDCTIGSCGNCSRGSCVEGFCKCDIGWEGAECDRKATCFAVDNCTSEVHGICKTTDVCECNVGFTGPSCATIANCYNVLNCSSNGVCIGIDECKCDTGYSGASCIVTSCESLGYCSGNGRCIAFDTCECVSGWSGPSCSIPDCDAVNQCSKKGECVGPNFCNCFGGYQGADCSIFLDCSHLNNCTDNGVCIFNNDVTGDTNICSCFFGFVGSNCSQYDCSDVNDCSGNGTCVEPNLCSCNMGYEGEMCLDFSCQSRSSCSGNGICVGYEECQCNDNWIGLSCETPTCYDMNNCSSNGQCVSPNKCECFEQYDGENCTEEVSENLNTPAFTNDSYFAVVSENRGKGFVVLSVYANDTDHGRSGEVSYIIEDASLANFFMVNQDSGEISVYADDVLDYETISQKQFTFTVTATDNGVPSRNSEATVTITVQDENDNCPVFGTLPGKYKLPVDILASDADYGNNGRIQYSITEESDPDRNFFITSHGELFANSTLQPGEYSLTVVAKDGGVVPCARELSLTVVIDEIVSVVVLPTSSSVATSTITLQPSLAVESNSTAYQQTPSLQTPSMTAQITSTSSIADVQSSSHFITSIRMKQSSTLLTTSIVADDSSSALYSSSLYYELTSSFPATSTVMQPFSSHFFKTPLSMKQSATLATPSTVPSLSSSAAVSSSLYYELTSSFPATSTVMQPFSSHFFKTPLSMKQSATLATPSTVPRPSLSSSAASDSTHTSSRLR